MKDWILVTGGAGYVGSHCVLQILQSGHNVVILDNLSNSSRGVVSKLEKLSGRTLPLHDVDLTVKEDIRAVFAQYSTSDSRVSSVIHFAALKSVGESCKEPLRYYQNNLTGSILLMEVMMEFNVKKMVFSSSATVYGQPQYLPIDENHPTGNCTNPYGKSKLFMEEIFKDVCAANTDWSCTLLRYFNPAGAHPSGEIGEDPQGPPNNLFPYVAQVAVGLRDKLSVFGGDFETEDGTGCRDYVHVMDLAQGHVAALEDILGGERGLKVYNLGTGRGHTVLQVVSAFQEVVGRPIEHQIVGRREGDVAECYAATDKARNELGFKADKTLLDMCRDEMNWRSKHSKIK